MIVLSVFVRITHKTVFTIYQSFFCLPICCQPPILLVHPSYIKFKFFLIMFRKKNCICHMTKKWLLIDKLVYYTYAKTRKLWRKFLIWCVHYPSEILQWISFLTYYFVPFLWYLVIYQIYVTSYLSITFSCNWRWCNKVTLPAPITIVKYYMTKIQFTMLWRFQPCKLVEVIRPLSCNWTCTLVNFEAIQQEANKNTFTSMYTLQLTPKENGSSTIKLFQEIFISPSSFHIFHKTTQTTTFDIKVIQERVPTWQQELDRACPKNLISHGQRHLRSTFPAIEGYQVAISIRVNHTMQKMRRILIKLRIQAFLKVILHIQKIAWLASTNTNNSCQVF